MRAPFSQFVRLTIHPSPIFTSQEGNDPRYIAQIARSPQRRHGPNSLINFLISQTLPSRNILPSGISIHIRLDSSRGNSVHSDLLLSEILRKASCESLDCCFTACIDSMSRNRPRLCADRAHKDESATRSDVFIRLLRDEELPPRVDSKHLVKLLRGDICKIPEMFDAGVGQDDVDVAEVGFGLFE